MPKIELGVKDGKLADCPSSPNCVSTQTEDESKKMEPIPYTISDDQAIGKITKVVNEMPRTKIVTQTNNYLHVTFTTRLFRFVDDVEFYFDKKEKVIHYRSASRTGYSDLGVNQKRMVEISKRFLV
ncbi:DUF1499 domain-containing protein [Chengkuizengella axinellae]|uniref:DUF1499 domain-containing protein n=1 Tax=Chengkuizengella axinellae TaxID=3064388 RepID=A0ABT9IXP3_9BACL|nr:DUF1499 domain-containing protein [Chengkuizengella sp. 2205SS18-9]MDP5274133.1 DUF1499 domain-containing protein [Chengkuizengella sp. 2205SS18-9]